RLSTHNHHPPSFPTRRSSDLPVIPVARTKPQQSGPIAIVAMAGRFSGAPTIEEFWANLRQGVESVRLFTPEELIKAGADPEALRSEEHTSELQSRSDLVCRLL